MPLYIYEGFNKNGRRVSGKIEAENASVAKSLVKGKGIYIRKISPVERRIFPGRERIRKEEFALSIRELATLLKSVHLELLRENARRHAVAIAAA